MSKLTDKIAEIARPVVEEEGCSLWDVEYVREAGTWYLRVFIDRDGGVSIDDCERVSRRLDRSWTRKTPFPTATSSRSAPPARTGNSSGRGTLNSSWAVRSR